jgi:hypothetical protein
MQLAGVIFKNIIISIEKGLPFVIPEVFFAYSIVIFIF